MQKDIREFYADGALVVVALLWGLTFLPMALALKSNGVYTILFWRFLVATALMVVISSFFVRKIDINSIKYGSVVGIFLFLGFAFQTFALKYTLSSTVAFITGLVVVFVPFLSYVLFRAKIYAYAYAGAIISAVGLYFLCSTELGFGLGELLSLICALAYTLEIILAARFVKKCEIFVFVTAEFAVTCLLSLICALFVSGSVKPVVDREFAVAVFVLALFATVIAFFVQNIAQRYTTPVKTALILTLEPVSAGIVGYFFGAEILTPSQIAGAGVILAGILLSEIGSYFKSCEKKLRKHSKI